MSILAFIKNQSLLLWKFTGFFQPKIVQKLHAITTILIIFNIFVGFLVAETSFPTVTSYWIITLGWTHTILGFCIGISGVLLIITSIYHKGLKHFFPYLWGEYTQLIEDIKASLKFKLIPPKSGGLAATVQGLGLGALFLTISTGILFFICWKEDYMAMYFFKELHGTCAILLAFYLLGHGGMAILHFIDWQRKITHKKE